MRFVKWIGWFLGSFGLDYYLYHFADYSHAYGPLGAIMGLMLWFYMVAFSIMVGADSNAEQEKWRRIRRDIRNSDSFDKPLSGIPSA